MTSPTQARDWFSRDKYSRLTIQRSLGKEKNEVCITDPEIIAELVAHVRRLPTKGDLMVSLGPGEFTLLTFQDGEVKDTVMFYGELLKLPDTSVLSDSTLVKPLLNRVRELLAAAPQWFSRDSYSALTIHRYFQKKSSGKVRVSDPAVITELVAQIKALPTEGEMMIKMGPVEVTELSFEAPGVTDVVAFYGQRLKTPATSFYSDSKIESALFQRVDQIFRKGKKE